MASDWQGVQLEDLVQSQLAPVHDGVANRVSIAGPKLRLAAPAAQGIGLALHELATNALKYGALSTANGRVDITWEVGETFEIRWRERGGPSVCPPVQAGFGTTVITRMAASSIEGEVDLRYPAEGLTWSLKSSLTNVLEAPHGDVVTANTTAKHDPHARV